MTAVSAPISCESHVEAVDQGNAVLPEKIHTSRPQPSPAHDPLIKYIDNDNSVFAQIAKGFGLRPLGSHAADYPSLLASITATTSAAESDQQSCYSQRSQQLLGKAAALVNRLQPLSHHITQLSQSKTRPGDTVNIAVVGNAPTLLSSQAGAEIDASDIVVRFNQAIHDPSQVQHTGLRTDIWVMSPSTPVRYCPGDIHSVLVSGHNVFSKPSRYWPALLQFSSLSECPSHVWYSLVSELHAPPSAGLLMLKTLQSLALPIEIKRFGFTDTQGIHGKRKNHAADCAPASRRHNWAGEVQWIQENC